MADSPNTTTLPRISFSSVDAIPPRVRARHAAVLPAVQLAHSGLIAALGQQTPHNIIGHFADRFDIMERRDHVQAVLGAVITYAKAIVSDTAENAPIGYIRDETGYLVDAASEIYGALDNAVERMLEDQAQAAE
jgi:predicted Zn-dependent protease with MMP-like domain